MALTKRAHRRRFHLDAGLAIQIMRQLLIGPVRPIQATARRALFDPLNDPRRQRLGDPPRLPRRPLDL